MHNTVLRWDDIGFEAPVKGPFWRSNKGKKVTLLRQITGQLSEGQMVAIMGPSGAGKSTLLDVLSGRLGATQGKVMCDPPTTSIKSVSSYVEQHDALLGVLTVRETLWYTAKLAFPPATPAKEIDSRVDVVLNGLGLQGVASNIIGTPVQRGISGGQRRRVTIACSLITLPPILFLDEPTSGLDAQTALEVMSCISSFAKQNNIAVCATIHSPNWEIFSLFASVTLLAKGRTVYSGGVNDVAPYFEELGYHCPQHVNPADHMLKIVSDDFSSTSVSKEGASPSVDDLANLWTANASAPDASSRSELRESRLAAQIPAPHPSAQHGRVLLSATWILTRRNVLNYRRNVLAYGIRFAMYVGMGVLLATVWVNLKQNDASIQDRLSVHFFSVAFLGFMSVAGIPSFLEDRGVLHRERANNLYGPAPFVLANTIVTVPFLFACAAVFAVICYWSIGLHPGGTAFFRWLIFLFLGVLAAEMQSLLIAAIVPVFVASLALAAFLNGFWMCTQGYFIRTANLPRFWYYWAHFINYETYAFALLVRTDLVGLDFTCEPGCQCAYPQTSQCAVSGSSVTESLDLTSLSVASQASILIAIIVVYRALFYLVLRLQRA